MSAALEPPWLALPPAERDRAAAELTRAGQPRAREPRPARGARSERTAPKAAPRTPWDGGGATTGAAPWVGAAHLPLPSVLAGLPVGVLRLLAGRLEERRYARGSAVLRQGEPGDALHLVVRGRFAVERQRPDGGRQRLATMGPGDLFGELALIDGAPRSATVRALTAGSTRTLARADLLAVLREHPDVALAIMARLARMIRRLDQQLAASPPAPRRRATRAAARRG